MRGILKAAIAQVSGRSVVEIDGVPQTRSSAGVRSKYHVIGTQRTTAYTGGNYHVFSICKSDFNTVFDGEGDTGINSNVIGYNVGAVGQRPGCVCTYDARHFSSVDA